ncbi:MAG: hypothetical protein HQK97_10865 [Nitrospirae bacterium]|nr:hypothetical protein [Nitrospirota bacterium]
MPARELSDTASLTIIHASSSSRHMAWCRILKHAAAKKAVVVTTTNLKSLLILSIDCHQQGTRISIIKTDFILLIPNAFALIWSDILTSMITSYAIISCSRLKYNYYERVEMMTGMEVTQTLGNVDWEILQIYVHISSNRHVWLSEL